ncbi:hypothetical protein RJ640_002743 [Escallonia rubra]|uniref:Uncharacterized protein n=1 Tax=Escallonia rubra TaxID=112253 RepID=A0AA88UUF3_9ASTE|nr:hypothetical protein RJ640_002743 [Escallonia rubra]
MEALKLRYFKYFLSRFDLELQGFVDRVKQCEQDVRDCYAEEITGLNADEFVEMILVDSGFIIELLLRDRERSRRDADDEFLKTPTVSTCVAHDLILLENQIPLFVLKDLYDGVLTSTSNSSVLELALYFFEDHNKQGLPLDSLDGVLHFADLIRTFFIPAPPPDTSPQRNLPAFSFVNSATRLSNVGLKFKVKPSNCLLDVKFENGVLEIPTFGIYDTTKLLLRNLMALEVCHYPNDSYIIDYVFMMNFLIDTVEDVDLLVEQGIIVNWLGQSAGVTTLFNNATTQISYDNANFYFAQVCHDLNEFYKVNWNRWKTTLNREYFGNPWKTVSTYAAVMLLLLAGAQTVCSVISVKNDLGTAGVSFSLVLLVFVFLFCMVHLLVKLILK